jgi:Na+/melibiose symporter-like transporter
MGLDKPMGEALYDSRSRLSLATKLTYSSGSIQNAMMLAAAITTLLYYNQVLGLSPSLCGTAFLIASIVDAVSDPLVGALSDGFRSRWGRRHPFMLLSALPFAVSIYLLYQPAGGLTETGLFIWLTTFSVLVRLSFTFFNVPYLALGAELTDDYHERTSLWGWFWAVSMAAAAALSWVVLLAVFPSTPEYENGLLNQGRYPVLAAMAAVVVFASIVFCTFGTRHQIPSLHAADSTRPGVKEYLENLGQLLINRSFISVCASWLTIAAGKGVFGVVVIYTWIYCYGISTEDLAILVLLKIPGALIVVPLSVFMMVPLSVFMTRRLDKKGTMITISLLAAAFVASPHVARLFGVFPGSESFLFLPLLFGSVFAGNAIEPVTNVVADSQLTDVCDDHELKTGVRAEGVVFSVRAFAMKATAGLGGLIGGIGLEVIGFPEDAGASELASEVVNGLLFIAGPFYFLIFVVGALFMAMYRLNEKRLEEIQALLEERRRANEPT